MKKFDVKKIHGKFTSPWKKFIENSQKILIKIHLKIHAKIRTEKNSPEKHSQELGTGIPDLASNLGILFFSRILKNQSGLDLRARNLDWLARSNPGFQLPASGSQFPAPGSGLPASGFWLPVSRVEIPALGSRFQASSFRLISCDGWNLPRSLTSISLPKIAKRSRRRGRPHENKCKRRGGQPAMVHNLLPPCLWIVPWTKTSSWRWRFLNTFVVLCTCLLAHRRIQDSPRNENFFSRFFFCQDS